MIRKQEEEWKIGYCWEYVGEIISNAAEKGTCLRNEQMLPFESAASTELKKTLTLDPDPDPHPRP